MPLMRDTRKKPGGGTKPPDPPIQPPPQPDPTPQPNFFGVSQAVQSDTADPFAFLRPGGNTDPPTMPPQPDPRPQPSAVPGPTYYGPPVRDGGDPVSALRQFLQVQNEGLPVDNRALAREFLLSLVTSPGQQRTALLGPLMPQIRQSREGGVGVLPFLLRLLGYGQPAIGA